MQSRVLSSVLLAFALAAPCWAQESPAPEQKEARVPSRNDVLKETFSDVSKAQRGHSVKLKSGSTTLGYGVLIQGGYVLTGAAVVGDRGEVELLDAEQQRHGARLIGWDRKNHVALLKTDAQGGAALGSSKGLFIGQFVVTVGLADTPLAVGCVSALNRAVKPAKRGGGGNILGQLFGMNQSTGPKRAYRSIVQHDSKIEDGMYGSPVYDAAGQLIGVNVERAYRGSSYLVGADQIRAVLEDLKSGKAAAAPKAKPDQAKPDQAKPAAARGYLGVSVEGVAGDELKALGLAFAARVSEVAAGSGAAKAGLAVGDHIVSVGGFEPSSFEEFARSLRSLMPGDTVQLGVRRGDQLMKVSVTLGRRPG